MKKIDKLLKKLSEQLESTFLKKEHILASKIQFVVPITLRPDDKIEIEILEGRYQLTKIFRNDIIIIWSMKEKEEH